VRKQNKSNPYSDPTVPVDYKSVVKGILRFADLRSSLGKGNPKIGVRATSLKALQTELTRYSEFWRKRVDYVEVASIVSWSGRVKRESGNGGPRHPCHLLWDHAAINWDGTLAPCCTYVDATGDGKGNLADLNVVPLLKAYYSPGIERVRLAHIARELDRDAPFCAECPDWRCSSPPGMEIWTKDFEALVRQGISDRK
jgi:hypothetical protein